MEPLCVSCLAITILASTGFVVVVVFPIFLVWQNVPSIEFPVLIIFGVQFSGIKYIHIAVQLSPPSISRTCFLAPNWNLVPIKQASQVVQCLRFHLPMQVWSLCREDPLEKEMATHSSLLSGESHGQRSLAGCSPWDCRVGHNWVCTHTHTHTHTPHPLNSNSPSSLPIFSSWQPPSSALSVWFNYSAHLMEIKSCRVCLLSHQHCTVFQFFHILINTYFLIFLNNSPPKGCQVASTI